MEKVSGLIESLSPIERKILPFLKESVEDIEESSGLDKTSVLRALDFLSNKNIVSLTKKEETWIELGVNGIIYAKQGLPERRLINLLAEKKSVSLKDAAKLSELDDNEFKVSLGVLKKKALINLVNGMISLTAKKEELIHKTLEEKFLEALPKKLSELNAEEKYAFENLKNRKSIITINNKKIFLLKSQALEKNY